MKLLLSLFLLTAAAFAQTNSYGVTKVTTLAGAAEVITVQGAMAAGTRLIRTVSFKNFDVTCSVACTVALERDGTAATATALTINPLNNNMPASTAVAFSGSNVGGGTVLSNYSLTAGQTISVSLAGKQLLQGADNLTLRTSSITGTTNINLTWDEK
jgi:hypothetical protein